jgi:hypothetical protein
MPEQKPEKQERVDHCARLWRGSAAMRQRRQRTGSPEHHHHWRACQHDEHAADQQRPRQRQACMITRAS